MFLSKTALSQNNQMSITWVFRTESQLHYILRQRPNRPLFQNQVRIKVFSHPVLPGDMQSTRKYSIIKSALPKVTLHPHLYFFLFLEKNARKRMEQVQRQQTCPRLLFKQKMNLAHNHLWAINELENGVQEKKGGVKMSMMKVKGSQENSWGLPISSWGCLSTRVGRLTLEIISNLIVQIILYILYCINYIVKLHTFCVKQIRLTDKMLTFKTYELFLGWTLVFIQTCFI